MDENPGVKFGEISRIVAERWRGMSDADKQVSHDGCIGRDRYSVIKFGDAWLPHSESLDSWMVTTGSWSRVQAYAERAKKVNEDKEKEEARREAERIRFVIEQFPNALFYKLTPKVRGGKEEEPASPSSKSRPNPKWWRPSQSCWQVRFFFLGLFFLSLGQSCCQVRFPESWSCKSLSMPFHQSIISIFIIFAKCFPSHLFCKLISLQIVILDHFFGKLSHRTTFLQIVALNFHTFFFFLNCRYESILLLF